MSANYETSPLETAATHPARRERAETPVVRGRDAFEVFPASVSLSGTVSSSCIVLVRTASEAEHRIEVRVEFPDEARSLLEAVTWRGGTTILETIAQVSASCIARAGAARLLETVERGTAGVGRVTLQVPLADLRSTLALQIFEEAGASWILDFGF
jgi:hypothetical protein